MAIIFLIVAITFLAKYWNKLDAIWIPPIAMSMLVATVMLCGQWFLGMNIFAGHALIGILYCLAVFSSVALGRSMEQVKEGYVATILFPAFVAAAIVTAGIILAQWVRIDLDGVWIQLIADGGRPYGNLNQPNLAGTLLLLGLVGTTWMWHRSLVGTLGLAATSVFLVTALMLTGSRTAYLSLALLLVVASGALIFARRFRLVLLPVVLALLGVGMLFWLSGPQLPSNFVVASGVQPLDRPLSASRWLVYQYFWNVVLDNPWLGTGFNSGVVNHVAAADLGLPLPNLFTWSHNVALDVLLWFGIPAGFLMLGLGVFSIARGLCSARRVQWLYWAAVVPVLIHAMLELPHGYAFFLIPTAFLIGAACNSVGGNGVLIRRTWFALLLVALAVGTGVIVRDYLRVESAFYAWRFEQARIGRHHPVEIPDTIVLDQMQSLLIGLRANELPSGHPDLVRFEAAVALFPSAAAIQHLVGLKSRAGDVEGARHWARVGHLISNEVTQRALYERWMYLRSLDERYRAVDWPAPGSPRR